MDTIFLDIMFPPYHHKKTLRTYETIYAWRTPPSPISISVIPEQYEINNPDMMKIMTFIVLFSSKYFSYRQCSALWHGINSVMHI